MSGKGEPLAKMARPPVAAWAWAAVHSDLRPRCQNIVIQRHLTDLEVGFESGKIIGGVSLSFMALRTSSLNRPPQADKPMRMLGLTLLTVSNRLMPSMSASETAKLERKARFGMLEMLSLKDKLFDDRLTIQAEFKLSGPRDGDK